MQAIKWPQFRKTQSITFSMHTLHLCSFSRIVPSSILLLAEILSLNPMPHNAKKRLTCWVVNFIISCSVTGATQSTSKTCCRQIGHSVNFFPHWLQVTRRPQSRRTQLIAQVKEVRNRASKEVRGYVNWGQTDGKTDGLTDGLTDRQSQM